MAGPVAISAGDVLPDRVTADATARAAVGSGALIAARLERLPMTAFQRNIFLIIATAAACSPASLLKLLQRPPPPSAQTWGRS